MSCREVDLEKGQGVRKVAVKFNTIRATDEEWELIKAYAEQVKLGKLPELSKAKEVKPVKEPKAAVKKAKRTKKLGQLAHATIN